METIKTAAQRLNAVDPKIRLKTMEEAKDAEIADLRAALAKQAEAAPVGADERAAFEADMQNHGFWSELVRSSDGAGYHHRHVADMWTGWQARAAIAQRAGSGEAKPVATTLHADAINALLSVATAAYDAMDNSEERANAAGGEDAEYIIQGNDFTALSTAMDEIDALPDDRPGYALSGGARASWALRDLFTAPPPQPDSGRNVTAWRVDWVREDGSIFKSRAYFDENTRDSCVKQWNDDAKPYGAIKVTSLCDAAPMGEDSGRDAALRDWLKRHEWAGFEYNHVRDGEHCCPDCGGFISQGHKDDCELVKFVAMAAQQGEKPAGAAPSPQSEQQGN